TLGAFVIRFLLLVGLLAAPLIAGAHGGHHAASGPNGAQSQTAAVSDGAVAVFAAGGHCPAGGGQEVCSCHGLSCTTPSQPVALAAAPLRELPLVPATADFPHAAAPVLRSAALLRFAPRGPPLIS